MSRTGPVFEEELPGCSCGRDDLLDSHEWQPGCESWPEGLDADFNPIPEPPTIEEQLDALRAALTAQAASWACNCGGPSPEGQHEIPCDSYYGDRLRDLIREHCPDAPDALRRREEKAFDDGYDKAMSHAHVTLAERGYLERRGESNDNPHRRPGMVGHHADDTYYAGRTTGRTTR